jgi:hypothetical protein
VASLDQPLINRENGVPEKTEFVNRFKLIWAVQMYRKNISLGRDPKSTPSSALSRPSGGRIAIVTDVGCGMRWTLWRRVDQRSPSGRRSRVVLTPRRWR